jgi:hypothetical protein
VLPLHHRCRHGLARPLAPPFMANQTRVTALLARSMNVLPEPMVSADLHCCLSRRKPMLRPRTLVLSLALAASLGAGTAMAQTQSAPAKDTSVSAQASQTMTDVSKWTRKQWNTAKAKWVEEKDAWNGCQTQAKAQNLAGRKSWQFLYDCMMKS